MASKIRIRPLKTPAFMAIFNTVQRRWHGDCPFIGCSEGLSDEKKVESSGGHSRPIYAEKLNKARANTVW